MRMRLKKNTDEDNMLLNMTAYILIQCENLLLNADDVLIYFLSESDLTLNGVEGNACLFLVYKMQDANYLLKDKHELFTNAMLFSSNSRAYMQLILAEWFAFIGRRAGPSVPGSPYAITFRPNVTESSGMKPMNVSTYSCGDISLGCSCGDCPSSAVCSNSASPTSPKEGSCSVRIGSLKVRE